MAFSLLSAAERAAKNRAANALKHYKAGTKPGQKPRGPRPSIEEEAEARGETVYNPYESNLLPEASDLPTGQDAMPLQPPSQGPMPLRGGGKLAAPYVVSPDQRAMIDKIFAHAATERSPKYKEAQDPIFGPADPKLTKELVPQVSIAGQLPPKPTGDKPLPGNDRSRPILENEEAIGGKLAEWMRDSPHAGNPLPFYSTGSVIQGLIDKGGLSHDEAIAFMKDWAGQGAATSPRTATPQNLRNAAYLLFRNASGDRLTKMRQAMEKAEGVHGFPKTHNQNLTKAGEAQTANLNRPGFAMMGMHTQLGDEFFNGTVDPWKNPKPYTFRENWSGNMADVTADTHNIRAVLDAYNELDPGGLPRGWFKTDDAYDMYKVGGGVFNTDQIDVGAIEDGLKGPQVNGRYAQTEYPILQGPTNRAAAELGIAPAEAQERLWFDRGSRTGLQSPRMAIPDLFNSQIEYTSRVLGISQEEVLKLFARHKIPLAEADVSNVPGYSTTG